MINVRFSLEKAATTKQINTHIEDDDLEKNSKMRRKRENVIIQVNIFYSLNFERQSIESYHLKNESI